MEHVHGLNHVHVIAVAVQQGQRRHRRVAERHLVAVGRMVRGRIRVMRIIIWMVHRVRHVQAYPLQIARQLQGGHVHVRVTVRPVQRDLRCRHNVRGLQTVVRGHTVVPVDTIMKMVRACLIPRHVRAICRGRSMGT